MSAKKKTAKKHANKKANKPARNPAKRAAAKKPASRKPAAKASRKAASPTRTSARKAAPKASGPQIVHWEIQSQNPDQLHRFYADAFGWSVDANNPMNYGMVASGGSDGINGGIGGSPAQGSRVLVYANVSDINAALSRIESLGGRTIMPRTDAGPVVMALYTDPEGNVMGIVEG
jgi:predicted enzyme related to lactoylglutathione lyase